MRIWACVFVFVFVFGMFGCGMDVKKAPVVFEDDDTDDDTTDDDTEPTVPEAPTDLVAVGEGDHINLTWQDNSDNELGFRIYRRVFGAGEFVYLDDVPPNVEEFVDDGLDCDSHFEYRVTAYNGDGESDPSNVADAVVVPCAPTSLDAVGHEDYIELSWQDNSSVEDGFRIYYREAARSDFELLAEVEADETGYTDECGSERWREYKVVAYNDAGESEPTQIADARTAPNAPTDLDVLCYYGDAIDEIANKLTWQDNSNVEEHYIVERREAGKEDWEEIAELDADATEYEDADLPCDSPKYEYRVKAVAGAIESEPADAASAEPQYWCWQTATIYDTEDDVGFAPSIAVDGNGYVHISAFNRTNRDLEYITNRTGNWQVFVVDSSGDVGDMLSIAVDDNGYVHTSYRLCVANWPVCTDGDLKYATNKSGNWVTYVVESTGSVGWDTSIALDSSGFAHMSYYDKGNGDLKYATNESGDWATYTIDSADDVGRRTSIGLDVDGFVHISYADLTNTRLKYATNKLGGWSVSVVDTADSCWSVGPISIAVGADSFVHISYYDYDDLKYATNASGTWVIEVVDSEGDVGRDNSLAVDQRGYVHIAYRDDCCTDDNLKYATNISGSWQIFVLDSNGQVGTHVSMAVDDKGFLHIAYRDDTAGDLQGNLKYATNRPPEE